MLVDNNKSIKVGNNTIEYSSTGYHVAYSMYGATDNIPLTPALQPWTRPTLTSADTGSSQTKSKYNVGGDHFAVEMDNAWNDGDRAVYKAFDGIIDLYHPENQTSSNTEDWFACALMGHWNGYHWIKFYNPQPIMITKYRWYYTDVASDYVRIKQCDFQYSDDNINWTTIQHSEFPNADVWTAMNDYIEVDITNSGLHKYYRVYVTEMAGNDFSYSMGVLPCRELSLWGYVQE